MLDQRWVAGNGVCGWLYHLVFVSGSNLKVKYVERERECGADADMIWSFMHFYFPIADAGDGRRSCMCTTSQLLPPCDILYCTPKQKVGGWIDVEVGGSTSPITITITITIPILLSS